MVMVTREQVKEEETREKKGGKDSTINENNHKYKC